ncbi:MAG: hypothetical protein ACQEUT_01250 [Bacillota bacterium]
MCEVEMKVIPSFIDDELAIVFHFEFKESQMKIGAATVYTYKHTDSQNNPQPLGAKGFRKNKYAVLREFEVLDEYKFAALKKMNHFLKVIGTSALSQELIA